MRLNETKGKIVQMKCPRRRNVIRDEMSQKVEYHKRSNVTKEKNNIDEMPQKMIYHKRSKVTTDNMSQQ